MGGKFNCGFDVKVLNYLGGGGGEGLKFPKTV